MEEQLAELGLLAALALGVVLGLKHALDPDHVVAVSTIVRQYRNPLRSFWVGVSWGLGHTTTLLIIGIVIIALRLTISDRLALLLEFFVGYADRIADELESKETTMEELRQRLPNLLVIGYLIRLLEERVK